MAPTHLHLHLLLLSLLLPLTPAFLLPLSKHPSSLHYLATSYFTPFPRPLHLVLDLGAPSASIRCSPPGIARRLPCRSLPCLSARVNKDDGPKGEDDRNVFCCDEGSACWVRGVGELVEGDAVFGSSKDLRVPGFLYGCASNALLSGLGSGIQGALGLGRRSRVSLPFQVAESFGTSARFSLCLSSSSGVLLLGGRGRSSSPTYMSILKSLTYTPLITASSGDSPHEYRINLSSININGIPLSSNSASPPYLAKLSTTSPYTTMPTPLYKAFSATFLDAMTSAGMNLVKAVRPFALCFEPSREAQADPTPAIDMVLQSTMVKWTIQGKSLMVRADDRVICLGIIDGGVGFGQEDEVVIGGYQLEDVFMEFDFGRSMLGFSPSLASMGTSCEELAWDLSPKDLS
ncbi:hypothetical protein MLD38_020492 [Melastoma candidum]|uniref:Uncharacterized protein n=1 Tax=Melastoma candidum TaxID=119954 RepID=A0ACB9QDC9_9MYRT|nr:hypothetical protein MLD38_020492 [Melastoma candidum]